MMLAGIHFDGGLLLVLGGGLILLTLTAIGAGHALLYKRDPRAAVSWIGVIVFVPLLGLILYSLFGINRIERKAVSLRRKRHRIEAVEPDLECTPEELRAHLGPEAEHLEPASRIGRSLSGHALLEKNRIQPLVNGEQAYPSMIEAIDQAQASLSLSMYIFEKDAVGDQFIDALGRARSRNLDIRVLIDDVGGGSTLSATERALRERNVTIARFLPILLRRRFRFANLRNHRKILVADGKIGFTGGMNIRESNRVESPGPRREKDVHFRMEGPVVQHLQEVFADDWAFTTGEILKGESWFPRLAGAGTIPARGVAFDPGRRLDILRSVLVGALACAKSSVRIVTPYFLPDKAIVSALNVAAMRGVAVDILIPSASDSRVMQWAMTAHFWQVLESGCRIWQTPPPFDHSKLAVIDGAWVFLGSANWDPRSLRLNFEFNVEAYDREFGARIEAMTEERRLTAREVKLADVDARRLPVRLRDGFARLFSPYL